MKLKRTIFLILGCIGLVLGAVGAVLPLLPAFPFLLMAAFCFAKSSERLHSWFIQTKLYKRNLETFVGGKGMTAKTKFRIILIVTAAMLFGFIMMSQVPAGRIIISLVWIFHIVYFVFGIKTLPANSEFTFFKNIEIEGMHCRQCAKRLECALNREHHIIAAVNYERRLAVIKANQEIENERLYEIIRQAGYRAKAG